MRCIQWLIGVALAVLVLSSLCSAALAQDSGIRGIQSMKLMAPGVGWAASSGQVFWTNDRGQNWKDITPPASPGTGISAVFFLNTSTGWALLSRQADPDEEREFDFAATTNTGASWTVTPLQVPDPSPGSGLSSRAWIDFVDASRGWISVAVNQGSGPPHSFGVLLTTEDGGKTWKQLKTPPAAKTMLFRTTQDGWLAENGDLFRTNDGGKTWQQVLLNAPTVMKSAVVAGSDYLPVLAFQDATHGLLLLGYVTLDSSGLPLDGSARTVLFSTADGGNTWSVREVVSSWADGPGVTLTDDTVLAVQISPNHLLTLTRVSAVPGASVGATSSFRADLTSLASNAESVRALTVLDANRIWLLAYASIPNQQLYTELLSSSDGGISWSKITPPNLGSELRKRCL